MKRQKTSIQSKESEQISRMLVAKNALQVYAFIRCILYIEIYTKYELYVESIDRNFLEALATRNCVLY